MVFNCHKPHPLLDIHAKSTEKWTRNWLDATGLPFSYQRQVWGCYFALLYYGWLQVSVLCRPHPSPPPSTSTIPAATGEVAQVGWRRKSPRHIQTAAHSPHNSSFICEQKAALEPFLMLSRTQNCHCHVVLCLEAENPIPDLPLAICFALMDHFRAWIFPTNHANGKPHRCVFKNRVLIDERVTTKLKQLSLVLAGK